MNNNTYEFTTIIKKDIDLLYIKIPFDTNEIFGKCEVPILALFDDVDCFSVIRKQEPYGYIIDLKNIFNKLSNKSPNDKITVTLREIKT